MSDQTATARQALLTIKKLQSRLDAELRAKSEPIAIVGMGLRLPGGADDPESFWRLLDERTDAVTEVPAARWSGTGGAAGWGGFLSEVDSFDAGFFGISPREAKRLDPQQRLLLEVTWEALERSGIPPEGLTGSRTGVFVGVVVTDYDKLSTAERDIYTVTGNGHSFPAGRLSYQLGAQGPSMTVDTACSSSLVAVHLACQSLRTGESTLALAGGVNLMLDPDMTDMLAGSSALSPDGRCRTFDARANGYVRGEGCGVLVLKRLSDAEAAGDPVLAVVRGSAVNSDGRSSGLTAPNVTAQKALLRQALSNARAEPGDIGYVETHGTGTPLGDPIEVEALADVLGAPRTDGSRCVLGAVKTNIGHLEAAAGVAGVIKAVLAMRRELIPANLHMRTLNPRIDLTGTALTIPTEPVPWTTGKLAGVSSFGISGTNAHVILAEAPNQPAAPVTDGPVLLPISARTEPALRALAAAYPDFLAHGAVEVARTAASRRHHHEHRAVFVADSRDDLAAKIEAFARGDSPSGVVSGRASATRPKVAFVFPGQGSQWAGMGRDLYAEEPVFAEALRRCDAAIRAETGWSVIDRLHDFDGVGVIQPVLFALEVALAELWRAYGVEPDVVIGHSMGEVAAAHVAGALSLEDAVKVICRRSRLLERISGQGAMALVELPLDEAETALSAVADRVSVAAVNGPRSTVVSGDPAAVEQVLAELTDAGVFCRRVKVEVASHSPQVDPLTGDLLAELKDIAPVAGTVPLHSTVTGRSGDGADMDAYYWVRNLRAPVLFGPVVQEHLDGGPVVFVELSPHPILLPSIDEVLTEGSATVASLRRDRPVFREAVAALHVHGYPVTLYTEKGRCVPLPTYPWQRERYWVDPPLRSSRNEGHPLLGEPVELATQPGVRVYSGLLDAPYLMDHRVRDVAVLPGAASVEMALYATQAHVLEDIDFERLVELDGQPSVQLVLQDGSFELFCRKESGWERFASGRVSDQRASTPVIIPRDRCPTEVSGADHYREHAERGIDYGPAFQGVERMWVGDGEAVGLVVDPNPGRGGHVFHPALLDACFQVLGGLIGGAALVPVGIDRITVHSGPSERMWVHARATGDLVVLDDHDRVLVEIEGLRVRALPPREPYADWLYDITWRSTEPVKAAEPTGSWIVLTDRGGVGEQLAKRLGAAVTVDEHEDDWDRLLDSVPHCTGIVNLRGLDATPTDQTTADSLAADHRATTLSTLGLVRAVARRGLRDTPQLFLVTNGAVSTAPLWGFARTLDMEHPEFRSVRIEFTGSVDDLLPELLAPDGENEIALGPLGRRVARLTRRTVPAATQTTWNGTYLITGGLGGLGVGLAEWMAEQGARHIVLVGRGEGSEAARNAVEALRRNGVEVVTARADVTRRDELAEVLERIDGSMPPLRGVLHAAMVLDDRTVMELETDRFDRVLAPKVQGAWNLHELTAERDLDFFVLYSSAATVLGSPGQANYAAANAFLGALAHYRRTIGKPALCVDWGLFAEAGIMADREADGNRLANRGVGALTPAQGTEILGALLGADVTQVAALRLNLRQWLEFYPGAAANPLFTELRGDERPEPVAPLDVRPESVEPLVAEHLGRILHIDPARIDRSAAFTSMGVDSLMAMELRNRLEAALGVRLSVTVLFAAPTVTALTEHLLGKLGLNESSTVDTVDAVDEYADVSTDDLLALLDESLDRVEGGADQ
ncbi:SDR family NAD(P)-dependent oxidoreductase [Allokutzneria oryzae]|uniref:SDR family NAD(P)-dependent oxidoreductase n=1 Tax=Allokutzneria oryzae TaxID=1378989 RepID=A0ABV5ZXQ5_9PSEU